MDELKIRDLSLSESMRNMGIDECNKILKPLEAKYYRENRKRKGLKSSDYNSKRRFDYNRSFVYKSFKQGLLVVASEAALEEFNRGYAYTDEEYLGFMEERRNKRDQLIKDEEGMVDLSINDLRTIKKVLKKVEVREEIIAVTAEGTEIIFAA